MSHLGDDWTTYWKSKTAITSIVGAGAHARIYEDAPRQGVKPPYVVFRFFEGPSAEGLSELGGVGEKRMQVDAYHNTPADAHALQEAIRLGPTQGHRGTVGSTFVHGVTSPQTSRHGSDDPPKGSKARRYWSSRDYLTAYAEATS